MWMSCWSLLLPMPGRNVIELVKHWKGLLMKTMRPFIYGNKFIKSGIHLNPSLLLSGSNSEVLLFMM
jgi:hypothetical protein